MANSLIARNTSREVRSLDYFHGNADGEIQIVQWSDLVAEADGLAEAISQRIDCGEVQPGQVLVLAPRRVVGYRIRDALNRRAVNAHSFFQEQALDGNPAKAGDYSAQEAFTLMNLLASPNDAVSLRCWIGFGSTSLNAPAWSRITKYCAATGLEHLAVLEKLATGEMSLPHTRSAVDRYSLLKARLASLNLLSGQDLVDALFPSDQTWADPFRVFSTSLSLAETTLSQLRDHIATAVTQPELPTDVDYVRIMSLHKSKGLTASLVVVAGCLEGVIPSSDDDESQEQQELDREEQRRLFYVAITRLAFRTCPK